MQFIKYAIFAMVSCGMTGLMAMQDIQRDFSRPGKDVVTLMPQDDEVGFSVDVDLAKSSKFLSEQMELAGIDKPIPLPNVTTETLERLLLLVDTGNLSEGLSLDSLVSLLRVGDYLDMEEVRKPLLEATGKVVAWDQAMLATVFNARLPLEYQNYLIKALVEKVGSAWDENMLKELLANEQVPHEIKLVLVKGLIEQNYLFLVQIVPEWDVHVKRCERRGKKPMECLFRSSEPTENDQLYLEKIKKLLGADYDVVKSQLLIEYQGKEDKSEWEGSMRQLKGLLDE